MTQPPYLTDDEIADITKPLKQGAARIRYLRELGVKTESRPDGQPLVWRADFEAVRRPAPAANDTATTAADWSGLRKKVAYGRGEAQKGR